MLIDAPVKATAAPDQGRESHIPVVPWVSPQLIAHCCESGVIEVSASLPAGRTELARGPITELHERLLQHARQREVDGRLRFLVPGMPEAGHVFIGQVAARCWIDWCADLEDGAVVWNRDIKVTP